MSFLLAVLPLGVDTFAIAAVVGTCRPQGWARWRISVVFVLFEGGMPLAGLAVGAALGHTVGSLASYLSGGLLVLLGGYLCATDDCWAADDDQGDSEDDDEVGKARRLINARGLALIGLGLSISLDELAIGFGLGLGVGSHLTQSTALVVAIAIQTLLVSQLGLSLGARISGHFRERLERLAAPALICLGVSQLAETLIRIGELTALDVDLTALGIGLLILAARPLCRRRTTPGLRTRGTTGSPHWLPVLTAPSVPDIATQRIQATPLGTAGLAGWSQPALADASTKCRAHGSANNRSARSVPTGGWATRLPR